MVGGAKQKAGRKIRRVRKSFRKEIMITSDWNGNDRYDEKLYDPRYSLKK